MFVYTTDPSITKFYIRVVKTNTTIYQEDTTSTKMYHLNGFQMFKNVSGFIAEILAINAAFYAKTAWMINARLYRISANSF